ncbi:MAG: DEAD/DEAH box helicase [Candidatus Sumerlaeota bacterium]|nr:DEAD/DEAH box helicase [Candidatus Sumerlaeota bacterium]
MMSSSDDLILDGGGGADQGIYAALKALTGVPHIARNITHLRHIPERAARYAEFPAALDPRLAAALRARGIGRLYTHQAQAVEAALAGRDIVVVTPTASGKTLCFNIPVVQEILAHPDARALYLFPTKALAQDQYAGLYDLSREAGGEIKVYTFDGDTPANARRAIRAAGSIVLTNPDMLHTGILPNHTGWIKLFENLRYIVVDEVHHYRGVFGSHVANVLRRLARMCEFYGSHPRFICCSATIANPREIAERLAGRSFDVIDDNGAPTGSKYFILYNPPVVNEELGIRRGVVNEARRIAARFLAAGTQTIVFARSRIRVEVLLNYLRKTMVRLRLDPNLIAGYRGGYLPNERRAIEQGVKSGAILGVVSTNALELGIDIGQLRAAVIAGYPGSVASTWQQAGRAGRSAETSVVVLIGSSSPLDQFFITHPGYFFGRPPEHAIVNPDNVAILANHIKCAAFELPFSDGEDFGGISPLPVLRYLADERVLHHSGGRWHWSAPSYPAEHISLRSASTENFVVINTAENNSVMAEVDYGSAACLIHTGAIYMHGGETFFIQQLNWEKRAAYARPQAADYYTDALSKTDIRVIQVDLTDGDWAGGQTDSESDDRDDQEAPDAADDLPPRGPDEVRKQIEDEGSRRQEFAGDAQTSAPDSELNLRIPAPFQSRNFGEVAMVTVIAKYKKIRFETHENIGFGEVSCPPLEMQTEAWWLTLAPETKEWMESAGLDLGAGLSGLAALLKNVAPIYVLCDPRDVMAVAMVRAPHDERPAIYLCDRYPGGTGLARKVFDTDRAILRAARDILAACACASGCPSCVGPETGLGSRAKLSARVLLDALLR